MRLVSVIRSGVGDVGNVVLGLSLWTVTSGHSNVVGRIFIQSPVGIDDLQYEDEDYVIIKIEKGSIMFDAVITYITSHVDLTDPVQLLALGIGVTTISVQILAGSERTSAWVVALAGNALWIAYVFASGTLPLLVMVLFMTGVYVRNLRRWVRRDRARAAADRQENAALGIFLAY